MTRNRLLTAGLLILVLSTTAMTLLVGYWGRGENAVQARADCERASLRIVATANAFRAAAVGNEIIAHDTFQSAVTRNARGAEAAKEVRAIMVYDSQTDQRDWYLATSRSDQRAIYYGSNGRPPFRCRVAYPDPRLIP